jgi:hypothetical protein
MKNSIFLKTLLSMDDKNEANHALHIVRKENFQKKNLRERVNNLKSKSLKKFKEKNFLKNQLVKRLPIIGWLPKYKIKTDLMSDFFSGLTIGVMNIGWCYVIFKFYV